MRIIIWLLIYFKCLDYKRYIRINISPLVLACCLHLHYLL